jgi:hypothetical protein
MQEKKMSDANPYDPLAPNAKHNACSSQDGKWMWDNGWVCPIQNHPDHY